MNNASIKKYFKFYLKENFGNKVKIDSNVYKQKKDLFLNYKDLFIQIFIFRGKLSFNCNNNLKFINNIGKYRKIIYDTKKVEDVFYNTYSLMLMSNYGTRKIINSEDDVKLFFNEKITNYLNDILLPRADKIKTIADCYELNKSMRISDAYEAFSHLLYIKLVKPSLADNYIKYLNEELLYSLGEKNWKNRNYYFENDELMEKYRKICALSQDQEIEEGRLLESDLVVTTKNEDWPTLDPDFRELIDPELKKLIYG